MVLFASLTRLPSALLRTALLAAESEQLCELDTIVPK